MDKENILKLLDEAFMHELKNSMVYVRNPFVIRQRYPNRVTEAIAVNEIRHM